LSSTTTDLVFMDFALPDISSVEVSRQMKAVEQSADILVVTITGHTERHTVVDSL
jgi:CheY-like chemotaxis protein